MPPECNALYGRVRRTRLEEANTLVRLSRRPVRSVESILGRDERAYGEFVEQIELDDVWTQVKEVREVCFRLHRKNAQLRAVRSHEADERMPGDILAIDTAMEQQRESVRPMVSSERRRRGELFGAERYTKRWKTDVLYGGKHVQEASVHIGQAKVYKAGQSVSKFLYASAIRPAPMQYNRLQL